MGTAKGGAAISVNEFVVAFIGVVIGLGVSDLLLSFHKLLRAGSRVKWDWQPLAYAVMMLYSLVVFWWAQFGYPPPGRTLTIAQFLPKFVFLVLTFLMVAAALPDEVPPGGLDLRTFYLESLVHRWGLLLTAMLLSVVMDLYAQPQTGVWYPILWTALPLGSATLAALAMRFRAPWFQGIAMAWIFAVTSYFNLFRPIGP
jgi:hypothetical protein